jgi:hypothetical protein
MALKLARFLRRKPVRQTHGIRFARLVRALSESAKGVFPMQTEHYKRALSLWGLGSASLLLGILGALLWFWVPMGMVLSIIGLLLGFVGWTYPGRSTAVSRMLAGGMVVSILALILDFVVAGFGLETIMFGGPR